MGLIYDSPDLAALMLTLLAAEESEGPGALEGRMHGYLDDLEQRNGTAYLELVAITASPANSADLVRSCSWRNRDQHRAPTHQRN